MAALEGGSLPAQLRAAAQAMLSAPVQASARLMLLLSKDTV